jgi:hypothetical protein
MNLADTPETVLALFWPHGRVTLTDWIERRRK